MNYHHTAFTTWNQWRYSAHRCTSRRECRWFNYWWCWVAAYNDRRSCHWLVRIAGYTDCIWRWIWTRLNQLVCCCHRSGWCNRRRICVCNINWLSTDSNCTVYSHNINSTSTAQCHPFASTMYNTIVNANWPLCFSSLTDITYLLTGIYRKWSVVKRCSTTVFPNATKDCLICLIIII